MTILDVAIRWTTTEQPNPPAPIVKRHELLVETDWEDADGVDHSTQRSATETDLIAALGGLSADARARVLKAMNALFAPEPSP